MVSGEATVVNKEGLHFRPAGELVKACKAYENCNIKLCANGRTVNAKSIMNVPLAGAKMGQRVTIICEGENEEEALRDILSRISNGFGL